MTDGLPVTTARLDPEVDACIFAESPMGPAGAVSVALAGGVTLWVDAADPLRIVELFVGLDDGDPASSAGDSGSTSHTARAVVAALLGAEPAGVLSDGTESSEAEPSEAESSEVESSEMDGRTVFGLAVDPQTARQRTLAGRLALLDDLRAVKPPSGWWSAEAALLCAQADEALGLSTRAAVEAAAASEALLGLATRPAGLPDGPSLARAMQAATVVAARLEEADPTTAARLRQLVAELGATTHRRVPDLPDDVVDDRFAELFGPGPLGALPADEPRLALRAVDRGDADLFEAAFVLGSALLTSGQLQPGLVTVPGTGHVTWHRGWSERTARVHEGVEWTFQPAEMLVRVPVEPGVGEARLHAVWVRVFDLRTGDLVAIAPLGLDDRFPATGLARVAVPRDLSTDDLALEVTSRPTQRPDGQYTLAVRRACKLGAAAGQAERLGWWPNARRHWEAVADAWSEIGDADRRAVALAYAARAAERSDDPAGSAVLLAEARAADCQWAARLLDEHREVAMPFLAEVFDPDVWTA